MSAVMLKLLQLIADTLTWETTYLQKRQITSFQLIPRLIA